MGYDQIMDSAVNSLAALCDPLQLNAEQMDRLTALRAGVEESEREEQFVFLRQQEEDAETLRAVQELLQSSGLERGGILSLQDMTRLLTLVRALSPNPNLDARILRQTGEPQALSQDLGRLLFGDAALFLRVSEFISRRHVGAQTALQFLAAAFPENFPLMTPAANRVLALTAEQQRESIVIARRCFDLPDEMPASDPALLLLSVVPAYIAAKDILGSSDFIRTHRLLTQKPRGKYASRKLAAHLYAPQHARTPAARLAETPSPYITLPQARAPISTPQPLSTTKASVLGAIETDIARAGFSYPPLLVRSAFLSLQSKPLLWLLGRNGVGKTRLTSLLASAITGDAAQFRLLPVRPDWHDSTPLLGYVNALAGQYVRTPFLDFLLQSAQPESAERAFFLCLDEMNLARMEHYFAEVLSAMETGDKRLTLPNGQTLPLPSNLFIMGTLNSDEAAVPLSRRVLDRANTLTLHAVTLDDLPAANLSTEAGILPQDVRQNVFLHARVNSAADARAQLDSLASDFTAVILEALVTLNTALDAAELGFAYRVRDEILIYCANAFDTDGSGLLDLNPDANLRVALDIQIVQKILPRITGTAPQIQPILENIAAYAAQHRFTQTQTHATRLMSRLSRYGFVRFDEI
jgi:hypothetical protein